MTDSSHSNWPSRLEWGLIAAFWITFALLSVGQGILGDPNEEMRLGRLAGELVEYGTWAFLTPLVFWFVATAPIIDFAFNNWGRALRNLTLHVVVALAVAITVDLSEELIIDGLTAGSTELIRSVLNFWFMDELMIYLIVLMAGLARSYYHEKKARQEEAERLQERATTLERQLTEARLEALRMQLNPHFLFNTLHAVSTLVDRDPGGVRRMIARLSELLRHVLDEEAPQEVPLSQELEFLEDYFEIQRIRFQGRLDTEVDVPPSLHDAQVPNLILQPVVENAIKHGASQVRGVGRIQVEGRREGEDLVLSVRDNGPGLPEAQEDGLGLRNVRARLRELYGENQSLTLETRDEGGTRAVLRLPYHTGEALYTAEERTLLADGSSASPST